MTLVLLFFFLQISLMSGLIENSWILLVASAFRLLELVLVTLPENPGSHRYVAGKGRQNPRGSRTTLGELLF